MGVVHLAQAPDGNRVALKVLRPHIVGDDEARERLAREVASLRRVRSPRIAEVIDADPWGSTPFVATRYIPGLSLHEHVRQEGPVQGADLRWFAAGLAEALVAVHSVGVLHRDIKPSNVLLEGRSPVLIDFGLARLAEDPRLTATGWLLGTPGYLAPEILYGDDATVASDVHSWAATVVFAATGRPPFGRGPAMAIMDRVRRGEHDLAGVPDALLPLLRDCLAPDPQDRPDPGVVRNALRAPAPSHPGEQTMPFAVAAAGPDDDPTDVLGPGATRHGPAPATTPQPVAAPVAPGPDPTRPLPRQTPWPPRQEPTRVPYVAPPPPQQYRPAYPPPGQPPSQHRPVEPSRQSVTGAARVQRGSMLLALFGLVTVGFALAPYLCLVAVALLVLALRAYSWTSDSSRDRRWRRGRSRWYDGLLTVLSSPWYVLVATGGTITLLVWSLLWLLIVGLGSLLLGPPMTPDLLLMGAVLALSLWWGPASRRLRRSTRRALAGSTRAPWAAGTLITCLVVALVFCALALSASGTVWAPMPGPPWREGTVLGDVAGLV